MILPKVVRNIIKKVAAENEITFNEALEAVYSQFKFVAKMVNSANIDDDDTLKSVRLRYFGIFYPHVKKIDTTRKKRKNERHNRELLANE